MNMVINKLKSNTGASILLALLFLLFAMAVGSIMLTAATVNLGRAKNISSEEQSYQAVKSAVSLIEKDLATLAFDGKRTVVVNYSPSGDVTSTTYNEPTVSFVSTSVPSTPIPSYADELILPNLKEFYKYKSGEGSGISPTPVNQDFVIEAEQGMPTVNVSVRTNRYGVDVVLWCIEGTGTDAQNTNIMTLKLRSSEKNTSTITNTTYYATIVGSPIESVTTEFHTEVTYPKWEIIKGGTP